MLLLGAAPALRAQVAPPDSGTVGQQQIRGVQDRGEAFAAQPFVPSASIPPQVGDAPPTAAQQRLVFPVSRIEVTGSTIYDAAAFEPLLRPHVGRPNTLAELRELGARIAERYRADGYPFTSVRLPGQQVIDGRVVLQVHEFSVTDIDFVLDGRQVETPAALRPAVEAILREKPVRLATLSAAEAEAARMPAYRIATSRIDRRRGEELRLTLFLARAGADVVAIQPPSLTGVPPDDGQRIPLRVVRITGNTALDAAALAPETAGLAGREVTLGELRAAARRIEARYAAAGVFGATAAVPPQVVQDGVVTIEVTELSIARVNVLMNGRPLPRDDLLSRAANAVTGGQAATVEAVQRQLYVLSHTPGVRIESVIPPVPEDPAAEIYLRRQPVVFTTALDNRGTSVAGPLQWGGMVTTNDLLGLNEQFQFQALTSIPFDQVRYLGGVLILPLTPGGLVGTVSVSHSEAYPGGYLAPNQIAAYGDMLSVGLNYPLIARADFASVLTLSLDAFNNSSSVLDGQITTSDERSRALRLGTTTTVTDRLGGTSTVRIVLSRGLSGLGARPSGTQINTRPGLELDASKIVIDATRMQPLPGGFRLGAGVFAQRASAALPAAEVMTFGGVTYGRAFDSGVISGDHGIAGKVSLSRPLPLGNPILPLIEPYAFFDIGETYSALKRPGRSSSASAASTGVGLRFFTGFGVGGSVEATLPLTRAPTVEAGRSDERPLRVFFLLFMQY